MLPAIFPPAPAGEVPRKPVEDVELARVVRPKYRGGFAIQFREQVNAEPGQVVRASGEIVSRFLRAPFRRLNSTPGVSGTQVAGETRRVSPPPRCSGTPRTGMRSGSAQFTDHTFASIRAANRRADVRRLVSQSFRCLPKSCRAAIHALHPVRSQGSKSRAAIHHPASCPT